MARERTHYLPTEERRAATVEAVVELAAGQNPAEITTTAIAEHMGLTQGALFRHFPSKDAILEATMAWVSERLLARLDKAVQGVASPADALEAMFMAHVDFVARHPGVPRVLFGELQRPGNSLTRKMVQTLLRHYRQRLHLLLEAGKTQGELDRDLDVDAAALLFIGTIQGLVVQSLLAGRVAQIRRDAPGVFAVYRRGIGARP